MEGEGVCVCVLFDTFNDMIKTCRDHPGHYDDVIMGAIASQITSLAIVYSIIYSGADQSKHQSSTSLAFVWGIHRGPVNSPHKWPVTRKIFPFDDVIMKCSVCCVCLQGDFPSICMFDNLTNHNCLYLLNWGCGLIWSSLHNYDFCFLHLSENSLYVCANSVVLFICRTDTKYSLSYLNYS